MPQMTTRASGKQIFCRVRVNRACEPQQMLDATRRRQSTDREIVEGMPRGEDEVVNLVFFKPDLGGRDFLSAKELEDEFESRGLEPDPYAVAAANKANPDLAKTMQNATQWKDSVGRRCQISFVQWDEEPSVGVFQVGMEWSDKWWFGGVPKSKPK